MKNLLLFTVLLLLNIDTVCAQQNASIDSLKRLMNEKTNTRKQNALILNKISFEYVEINQVQALLYARKALQEGEMLGKNALDIQAESYQLIGSIFLKKNKPDSAKNYYLKANDLCQKLNDKLNTGIVNDGLGSVESDLGHYDKSLQYYFKALKNFEEVKNESKIASQLAHIGCVYYLLGNFEKLYEYTTNALNKYRVINNKAGIAMCLANLSDYYFQKNDTLHTYQSLTEAQQLFHQLNQRINEANVTGDIGDYYSVFYQNYDKAISYYNQSLKLLNANENKDLWMDGYRKISLAYYHYEKYDKAFEFAQKAIKVTDTSNLAFVQINYYLLTYVYMGLKDFKKAEASFDKYVELTQKVFGENQTKKIAELEVKYQTEKKEQKIQLLEKEKKISTLYVIGLIGLLVFTLTTLLFINRSIRNKQVIDKQEIDIQKQKITELEKDRQIVSAHAVIEGETSERTRISKDLHDGLGGLLSGVKLKLASIKGNAVLGEDNVNQFDHAITLLDNSIKELRRVAHNMMPEALIKFGLRDALQDFCDQISTGKELSILFNFLGENKRFESSLEITIYRIAQELANNSLKHANATEILVQVIQEDNRIHLTVMDDGQGFDTSTIDTLKSAGLNNIRARVESFKGNLDIDSQPGKGTEIGVEFDLS